MYSVKICLISLPWLDIDDSLLLCHQMLKQIRTVIGCGVDLSFWDLMTTHEVFQYSLPLFFFSFLMELHVKSTLFSLLVKHYKVKKYQK